MKSCEVRLAANVLISAACFILGVSAEPPDTISANADALTAIKAFDTDGLLKALDAGADPNFRTSSDSETTMGRAITQLFGAKHPSRHDPSPISLDEADSRTAIMMQAMINKGGALALVRSPLNVAAMTDAQQVAKLLLSHGEDPNEVSHVDTGTPLYTSIRYRSSRVEQLLLQAGAKPLSPQDDLQTRLGAAAMQGDLEAINKYVQMGAHPDIPDPTGCTALLSAVGREQLEAVKLLLELGASPRVQGRDSGGSKTYPLHVATRSACLFFGWGSSPEKVSSPGFEILTLLLEHGAAVSAEREHDHKTPLHIAAWFGNTRIATILIEAGAKIMPRDHEGRTPLDEATTGPMIKLLKSHGATEK